MRVALTFDAEHPDRPEPHGGAGAILDTLEQIGTQATFFIQGRWAEAYPRLARRIADAGHVVGSHSFYHARMPVLSDAGFRTDVRAAERVIRRICGHDPQPFFRCPFGAGSDDPRTHRLLAQLGYRDVNWNVEPDDWHVGMSGPRLARATIEGVTQVGDGAIVLLHTWPGATTRALPGIIADLRARGAQFVGVDQLAAG